MKTVEITYALGFLGLEFAIAEIAKMTPITTGTYTLVVSESLAGLAIRLQAVCLRLGCCIDPDMSTCQWSLVGMDHKFNQFRVNSTGGC